MVRVSEDNALRARKEGRRGAKVLFTSTASDSDQVETSCLPSALAVEGLEDHSKRGGS